MHLEIQPLGSRLIPIPPRQTASRGVCCSPRRSVSRGAKKGRPGDWLVLPGPGGAAASLFLCRAVCCSGQECAGRHPGVVPDLWWAARQCYAVARLCPKSALEIKELPDHSGIGLSLIDSADTLGLFPHRFHPELRPERQALAINTRVIHLAAAGEPPRQFCFGLHPYFAVPDLLVARLTGLPALALDQAPGASASTAHLLAQLPSGVDLLAGPTPILRLEATDLAVTLDTQAPLDLEVVWTAPPRPMVWL